MECHVVIYHIIILSFILSATFVVGSYFLKPLLDSKSFSEIVNLEIELTRTGSILEQSSLYAGQHSGGVNINLEANNNYNSR